MDRIDGGILQKIPGLLVMEMPAHVLIVLPDYSLRKAFTTLAASSTTLCARPVTQLPFAG
jgi:hypothetical protein